MPDPTIPSMDELVAVAVSVPWSMDAQATARAILTAVLPLVTGPVERALHNAEMMLNTAANEHDYGSGRHPQFVEASRRARTVHDQLEALGKGGG